MTHYRHTQTGWPVMAGATVGAVVVLSALGRGDTVALGLILLLVAVLPLILFGALTVVVDDARVEIRFGIGLIRRRVELRSVRAVNHVRNPWYYGLGIRLIPGGWLYNISGSDAVELQLTDGRRVRIGTDEPERLAEAIRQMAPRHEGADGAFVVAPGFNPIVWALTAVVLPCLVIVGVLIYRLSGPLVVRVSPDRISVRGSTYSGEIPARDVVSVSLETTLPAMSRTRGFGFGSTLRGRVRFGDGSVGHAFVERGYPPYVVIRANNDTLWINFKEPARTRRLYEQLSGLKR